MHIVYDAVWLYRSILSLILVFVLYKRNRKAQFVAPYKALHLWAKAYQTIVVCCVICCILLPLQLRLSTPWLTIREPSYAAQILFDVSLSMTAKDLPPSRFSVAKQFISSLIQSLPQYQWSTIFFSWLPVLRTAYSHDTDAIVQNLSSLSMGDFPPTEDFVWTAIGDAFLLGLGNIRHIQWDVRPFFILITDGDSNKGYDPEQVLPTLKKLHIPVYTIWLGIGSTIIGTDTFGTSIHTDINLDLLKHIAKETWGEFFYVQKTEDFAAITTAIQDVLHHNEQTTQTPIFVSINPYILFVLLVMLTYIVTYRTYVVMRSRSF